MSFKESILNNPGQKLFSLLLATLLWYAISITAPEELQLRGLPTFRQQERGDYQRPISIMNSANNRLAFSLSSDMADIVLIGDANKIKQLDPESIRVFVDVSQVTTQTIVDVVVSPPPHFTLEEVYPPQIEITPLAVATNTPPDPDSL